MYVALMGSTDLFSGPEHISDLFVQYEASRPDGHESGHEYLKLTYRSFYFPWNKLLKLLDLLNRVLKY